jgi:hypothetical protein
MITASGLTWFRCQLQFRALRRRFALIAAVCLTASLTSAQEPAGQPNPQAQTSAIAIVPTDVAASVTGASQVNLGKAIIINSGTVTSGARTTDVLLPRRGTLRICAATTVHFSTDKSVPSNETPGLMLALDHGAVETSFATGSNSDLLLTPDFRILIGGSGSSEVKVRLGEHGDTCVDNPGANAPYVIVSSVFEGGAYRVQPGQRVMFQHGSLGEVVDQEKEPCGCPAEPRPNSNDFPLAQSAGLAPLAKPTAPVPPPAPAAPKPEDQAITVPLVYSAAAPADKDAAPVPVKQDSIAQPSPVPVPAKPVSKKKSGFFGRVGGFFKRLFGAE